MGMHVCRGSVHTGELARAGWRSLLGVVTRVGRNVSIYSFIQEIVKIWCNAYSAVVLLFSIAITELSYISTIL